MSNKNTKYPVLRPISTTAQSPSHSNLNSHRKSLSKNSSPVVRFKDDPSSQTDLPKASDTSSPLLSPLLRLEEIDNGVGIVPKPVDISLDPGVDGVFDQALVRLDQLLDRQAQKAHMKKVQLLGAEKTNSQPRESTVIMKNMQMIQRVSKYKNIKGITPKTKEYRFEERLAPFKDVKTFIDIRKIVKDMGSPVHQTHSGNVSNGTPKVLLPKSKNAPVLEGFNEIYEQMNGDLTPVPSASAVEKRNSTFLIKRPSASNEFFTTLQSKLHNVNERESPEVINGQRNSLISRVSKEGPEISEKIQEAHKKIEEQLKRHMGPRIRNKLGKALQKKDVFERISQRKQASLNQMRETQKNLDDLDAFHTLMDFLSEKDVSKEDDDVDLAKDEGPDTFYTKLEKNVLRHEEKDDEFTEGRLSAMPENEKHDLEDHNINIVDDEKLTYEMEDLQNNLLGDEQVRIMTTLQAYKKRSDKIISILKKKTKRLQQEAVIKRKAAVIKEKLSSVLKTVPTIKETTEEHVGGGGTIANAIGLRSDSLANKGRASLFRTSIRLRSLDGMADIRKDPSLEIPQIGSRLDFELKMKENKKKFIELKQENKRKQFYLTQTDIKKPWVSRSKIEGSNSLNTFYNFGYGPAGSTSGFEEKQQSQKSGQFTKSLKKICGDVSELLTTNKSLNTEVKRTIVEREKYFSGKVREITDQEVPEALIMQKKPDFTHKKAKFIMNLTKHLLKER